MSWTTLLEVLVLGLPGQRPGGLVLTVLAFLGAALGGLALGIVYALACVAARAAAWPLMVINTCLRGLPPMLLVFALAHLPAFSPAEAGAAGLALYSLSHTGEALRAYLAVYPRPLAEAARVMGVHPLMDWLVLRLGWSLRQALPVLATHWVSLLKDTGALVVVGVGELTTVAKLVAESTASVGAWATALAAAAALYLLATYALLTLLDRLRKGLEPSSAAKATLSLQPARYR